MQDKKKLKEKHHGSFKVKYLQKRGKFRNVKDSLERDNTKSVRNLCSAPFPSALLSPASSLAPTIPHTPLNLPTNAVWWWVAAKNLITSQIRQRKSWSFVSSIYDSQGVKQPCMKWLQMGAILFPDRNPSVCICLLRDDAYYIQQPQESKPSGLQLPPCHTRHLLVLQAIC